MSENHNFSRIIRSVIAISGQDKTLFLQGLISNDITLLPHQPALYACLLTPQGKFLHDFMIVQHENIYMLSVDSTRAQDLIQTMLRYRLRADVNIVFLPEWQVGISANKTEHEICFTDPRHPSLGFILFTKKNLPTQELFLKEWNERRIRLGIPDGAHDADIGLSTLEELNITKYHGVSFTKGCYIGQELTARMHNRGLGKKHLIPIEFDELAPSPRLDILCGETIVGQLRSIEGKIGLALIKDDYQSSQLTCQEKHLKVLL